MSDETLDAELAALLDAGRGEVLTPEARASVRSTVARRIAMPYVVAGVGAVGIAVFLALWWPPGTEPPGQSAEPPPITPSPVTPSLVTPAAVPVTSPIVDPLETGLSTPSLTPAIVQPSSAPPPVRRERRVHSATPATDTSEIEAEAEATPSSTLQREVALLTRAYRALEQGQPRAALTALEEHAQRFPNGVLQLDRNAARWVARCELGPSARVAGIAFAERHPRVPMADRIRAVCTGDNP